MIDPNQLIHYQKILKDDPYDVNGMRIETSGEDLVIILESEKTTIHVDRWTPSLDDLDTLPHIILLSRYI